MTKTPLPNPKITESQDATFSLSEHARHVLFNGTSVLQTRYYGTKTVRAVVLRTGMNFNCESCLYSLVRITL